MLVKIGSDPTVWDSAIVWWSIIYFKSKCSLFWKLWNSLWLFIINLFKSILLPSIRKWIT
jgi:hypothetical protein